MAESDKQLIVVVGGTGMFGGSIAHSLAMLPNQGACDDKGPTGSKARHRADEGFEVVKADSKNPAELDSAFRGCLRRLPQH